MRVLLVEDDAPLRATIARGLREAAFVVQVAADAREGLAAARDGRFDLVILDLLLPGMSGMRMCRQLRQEDPQIPILILTALAAVEQRISGLDAGADDYLTKPFDFGELVARARALTRRRGDVQANNFRAGDLTFVPDRRMVMRGEREIPLTLKEFVFLEVLARAEGKVVTRQDLAARVWGDDFSPFSNLIDVYAARLRRKVDEGEAVPLLFTQRGVGYRLAVAGSAPVGDAQPVGRARVGRKGQRARQR